MTVIVYQYIYDLLGTDVIYMRHLGWQLGWNSILDHVEDIWYDIENGMNIQLLII